MSQHVMKRLAAGGVAPRDILMFVVGMALLWLFLRRSFYGVALSLLADPQAGYRVFLTSTIVFSCGLLIVRGRATKALNEKPVSFACACGALSLGAAFVQFLCANALAPSAIEWLCSCLLGASFPLLVVMWGEAALALVVKNRLVALCAVTVAFLTGFVISVASAPCGALAAPLFLCFPLLSAACWLGCHRGRAFADSRLAKLQQLNLVPVLVPGSFIVLVGLLRGLYYSGSISYLPGWDVAFPGILSMLMALVMLVFLLLSRTVRKALCLAIVAFALLLLVGLLLTTYGSVKEVSLQLIVVGKCCFELLLFLSLVDGARNLRISPVALFVVLFLSFEVASAWLSYEVSPLLIGWLGSSLDSVIPLVAMATTLLFVAGCFLYLSSEGKEDATVPVSSESAEGQTALKAQLESMEGYADLTPREREIALLLGQGNSYKRIAELLYVSPSTVQTHAKALYRKLAIHSKQELVDQLAAD